jgi:uncharacterized RDD family membrane protein YckC
MQVPNDRVRGGEMLGAQIARVVPRIGADVADVALLGLVGLAVGLLIGDQVAPAGTPARLLGLLVAVPYFAVFGSRLGGGQTFGKTLFKLRVVDRSGQPLSLPRSTVRAIIVTTPWLFNGLFFRSWSTSAAVTTWVAGVLVFGLAAASIGTFLFSPRTRQTVHDLVVGSYVVSQHDVGKSVLVRTPRALEIAAAAWIVLVACVSAGTGLGAKNKFASDPLSGQLAAIPNVTRFRVGTTTVTRFEGGPARTQEVLQVAFWYHGPDDGVKETKRAVVSAILWHHPGLGRVPQMQLTVIRGWDLGIASWSTSETETRSLDEWRAAD